MTDDMKVPAIEGGTAALKTPYGTEERYGADELKELKEALDQGTLFYAHGKKVKQLEADFAAKVGVPYAVACSSGTAAIHTAMMAVGISPGDEVITTPITDMGSIAPILFQYAIPVFADLHPNSYCIEPKAVEAVITPKTRAILAVHLWGNSCDLDALQDICKRHNLILIEDCAQAWGCTYKGKPVGTIGDIGCFSLNEFKHISAGDGGMVITKDANLARRARLSTDKCYSRESGATERDPFFLANNYRMTELQGAVGVAQLRKLDSIVARRRKWAQALSDKLKDVKGITVAQPTEGCDPSWWFFSLRVNPAEIGTDTDTFASALEAEGVQVMAHYIGRPVYQYPIFQKHSAFERGSHPFSEREYKWGDCPVAEQILETFLHLPCNEAFTEANLEETAFAIRRAAEWYSKNSK